MRKIVLLLSGFLAMQARGQSGTDLWTLQRCIDHAVKNTLDVQSAQLTTEQTRLNYNQTRLNMLPNVTASSGFYQQAGRNIDRFTNTSVQATISNGNIGLGSSVLLFAGGTLRNNVKAYNYTWLASQADMENVEQNVALNVANLFLQAGQAKELVKSYQENLQSTISQIDKAQKQLDAGAITEGTVLNLKAQKANDELNIVNAQNQEIVALTNLKLLLRLPFEQNFDILIPGIGNIAPTEYPETMTVMYDSAMNRRPDIKATEMRLLASTYRRKAIKGALYPSLSFGINLNSVYSSNSRYIEGFTLAGWNKVAIVDNVTRDTVIQPRYEYTYKSYDLKNQLRNNFGQTYGFSLSIPVFANYQNRTNIKLASLDLERARINVERSKQTIYNEVVSAYNAYQSALNRYRAAILNNDAQKLNLDFIQKRFDAGQASTTDLQIARSSEAFARVNLVSVRFEFVFRKLVLDFYKGQPLELN